MTPQTWMVYEGNALKRLTELPSNSVHCAIGSPPYWGALRDYMGHAEQLGHEPHPRLYALAIADIYDEVFRVLRPDGTAWLNLGDAYVGSGGAGGDYGPQGMKAGSGEAPPPGSRRKMAKFEWHDPFAGFEDRDQLIAMLIEAGWSPPAALKATDQGTAPWETAMELRQRGWLLRCDVIWWKRNPRPGGGHLLRPTIDHEYVFQLCKGPKTFYDSAAVTVPAADGVSLRNRRSVWALRPSTLRKRYLRHVPSVVNNGVSTFKGAHFATFPAALIEPMIQASTSAVGVCPECGAPWKRIEERTRPSTFTELKELGHFNTETLKRLAKTEGKREDKNAKTAKGTTPQLLPRQAVTIGWAKGCKCPIYRPAPALVLDPFTGAGSTGMSALALGRSFVGIELAGTYVEMIAKRLTEAFPEIPGQILPLA